MSAETSKEMSILEHLAELRRTLFVAVLIAIVATVLAWIFSDQLVELILAPAVEAAGQPLYFTKPGEAFLLKLKVSVVAGLFFVLPLILMRAYAFILPGLLERERRLVTPLLLATTLLFYTGVLFCFFVLMPMMMRFFRSFETESMVVWWTAGEYFSVVMNLALAFGLLFELPVVVFVLSWAGVVAPSTLLKGWRYALVIILIVAAVLTPPDVLSQVVLAAPVMLLYLLSCVVSLLVVRRRRRSS